jgi:hypothetical protein
MNITTKQKLLILIITATFSVFKTFAGTGVANVDGDWTDANTWLINGMNRIPAGGDTLDILAGKTVTVDAVVTITGLPVYLYVHGTLLFNTGKKLVLPCNSYVFVYAGGHLDPGNGGGNSNYIEICSSVVWNAAAGPVTGPAGFGNPPLPIKLMDFNAKYSSGKVYLDWTTATEINNDYFLVQRSSDNIYYSNINQVSGNGNSSQTLYYSDVDAKPLNGINYYRLCQVDYDGTRTYSYPRAIRTNGKADVLIFPNPGTAENISVLFTGSKNETYSLEVRDITGKTVLKKENQILESGINKLNLDRDHLISQGTYFVSIFTGDEEYHQKMIIY